MASATPALSGRLSLSRLGNLALPLLIMVSVLVLIVPLPAALLDVLLAANITASVLVLLTTIAVRSPLEFSAFPSVLLAATLVRLVLNVATTRLILTQAQTQGLYAAGGVVRGFGMFVAGDKVVVGLVIFAIIVVIQFVVITKGATRISEVAARFALDGMPGRQLAVDADLNAGMIDRGEAQRRRQQIAAEADFFGAMDGASKFVRGDAIAAILITMINIIGGLAIGVLQAGMSPADAGGLYTRLTIGDGLVTQVPALLVSLAAALLVTRSSRDSNLSSDLVGQVFLRPETLAVAGGFLMVLIFTNLPRIPLLMLGFGCVGLSVLLTRREQSQATAAAEQERLAKSKAAPERIENFLAVEALEVEVGLALVRLADPARGGDLLERISRLRQSLAAEVGILVPKIRVRDNLKLKQHQYQIKIADSVVAVGVAYPGLLLAVDSGTASGPLEGREARDPANDARAVWIEPAARDRAGALGYKVVESCAALATHLAETIRRHADEILSRDATKHLIDELKQTQPAVVDELAAQQIKVSEVQAVLRRLLKEQVPVRQLGPILETIGDNAPRSRDAWTLAERVRRRLARTLCDRYRAADGTLYVAMLAPALDEFIRERTIATDDGPSVPLSPMEVERITAQIASGLDVFAQLGQPPVLLVSPPIRAGLKRLVEPYLPRLAVLSYEEITRDTPVESVALIAADGLMAGAALQTA